MGLVMRRFWHSGITHKLLVAGLCLPAWFTVTMAVKPADGADPQEWQHGRAIEQLLASSTPDRRKLTSEVDVIIAAVRREIESTTNRQSSPPVRRDIGPLCSHSRPIAAGDKQGRPGRTGEANVRDAQTGPQSRRRRGTYRRSSEGAASGIGRVSPTPVGRASDRATPRSMDENETGPACETGPLTRWSKSPERVSVNVKRLSDKLRDKTKG